MNSNVRSSTPRSSRSKNSKEAKSPFRRQQKNYDDVPLLQSPTKAGLKKQTRKQNLVHQPGKRAAVDQPTPRLNLQKDKLERMGSAKQIRKRKKSVQWIETDRSRQQVKRNWISETSRSRGEQTSSGNGKGLNSRIKQLEDTVQSNRKEISFLRSLFTAKSSDAVELQQLRKENQDLKSRLAQAKASNLVLQRELGTTKSELQQLRQKHTSQQINAKEYRNRINQQIDQLNGQLFQLRTERPLQSSINQQPVKQLSQVQKQQLAELSLLVRNRVEALFLSALDLAELFHGKGNLAGEQVCEMLSSQPFLLTTKQAQSVQQRLGLRGMGDSVAAKVLRWVGEIRLLDEDEEQQMIESLGEFVTQYQNELRSAILKFSSSAEKITRKQLGELMRQIGLDEDYVSLVVRRMSLYSEDLASLSIKSFWQIFVQKDCFERIEELSQEEDLE